MKFSFVKTIKDGKDAPFVNRRVLPLKIPLAYYYRVILTATLFFTAIPVTTVLAEVSHVSATSTPCPSDELRVLMHGVSPDTTTDQRLRLLVALVQFLEAETIDNSEQCLVAAEFRIFLEHLWRTQNKTIDEIVKSIWSRE